jgi:hypothetical protein
MAVYGPVRHQKNIIWTEQLRSIYYFWGDEPVHILPYDPQCHELFAIDLSILTPDTLASSPIGQV